MTGAMQGSTHSLRQTIRTRQTRRRRSVVSRWRMPAHRGEFALIQAEFAHRFFLAMQEVCTSARIAMLKRLEYEKEAALVRVRAMRTSDADVVRRETFRMASQQCCVPVVISRTCRGQSVRRHQLRRRQLRKVEIAAIGN